VDQVVKIHLPLLFQLLFNWTIFQCSQLRLHQIYYFKCGQSRTWPDLGTQIQLDPELGRTFLGSQNNVPDETNGVNNAISCYKEAVQFSVSFVTSMSAFFWQTLWNSNDFCIFIIRVTLIKIANTPFNRSAALSLSTINCSCTNIRQIRPEI